MLLNSTIVYSDILKGIIHPSSTPTYPVYGDPKTLHSFAPPGYLSQTAKELTTLNTGNIEIWDLKQEWGMGPPKVNYAWWWGMALDKYCGRGRWASPSVDFALKTSKWASFSRSEQVHRQLKDKSEMKIQTCSSVQMLGILVHILFFSQPRNKCWHA